MSRTVVEINVGGTLFAATEELLIGASGEQGFFAALLTSDVAKDRDNNGVIFVDRDPSVFVSILRYIRSGTWTCPTGFTPREVLQEAKFYGIHITPCDFTIEFLREEVKVLEYESSFSAIRTTCETIHTLLNSLINDGKDLVFAVVPSLETLKELLRNKFLKTGTDTTENIDVDKLHVLDRTEESITCRFTDELHGMLLTAPLEGVVWYLLQHYRVTMAIEKGGMWFPYSTTVQTPDQTLSTPPPSTHAPVFSKLHGSLHTFKEPPSSRVISSDDFDAPASDMYANLHQRFLPVCQAFYICWEPDRDKRPQEMHAPVTPLCL
eukprot:TRINITY_DN58262_c0_g1_i1.p1 TRINITY_DN58262_c0_g1~~TRINITY_DN58262_c0_g1_i1.p1  ORF type:complete len:322 (+),score=65.33 TRINITY_DN58262_c0_g1_i1:26-991(+)